MTASRLVRWFRRVIAAAILLLWAATAAGQGMPPVVLIGVDPALTVDKYVMNYPRIRHWESLLHRLGYQVAYVPGTPQAIRDALLGLNVRGLIYVGEGGLRTADGHHVPVATLAGITATDWRQVMQTALQTRYALQMGMPADLALRLAVERSRNFGLDFVRNYSCWSATDFSIPDAFVRPGGRYAGSPHYYTACPLNFLYYLLGNADFLLTEYVRNVPPTGGPVGITPWHLPLPAPNARPAPVPTPAPPASPSYAIPGMPSADNPLAPLSPLGPLIAPRQDRFDFPSEAAPRPRPGSTR